MRGSFESAGADAIELNLYQLATRAAVAADEVEADLLEIVHLVSDSVRIPVAVKISPFHTSPANFAMSLEHAGAAGVVTLQPVLPARPRPGRDGGAAEAAPVGPLRAADAPALARDHLTAGPLLPGRDRRGAQRAGRLKALFAGAHAVQVVSALLQNGPRFLAVLLNGMRHWMGDHGYTSVTNFAAP